MRKVKSYYLLIWPKVIKVQVIKKYPSEARAKVASVEITWPAS